MRSRTGDVAALLALAALAFVLAVPAIRNAGGTGSGPLNPGISGAAGAGLSWDLGKSLSFGGGWIIRNPSDYPLTLDGVKAVGVVRHSPQLLGAYVVPLGDQVSDQMSWPGFRVPAAGQALPGAVIRPHEKLQFVLRLRTTKRGRHTVRAVDILYHDGLVHYRVRAAYTITICTPNTMKPCEDALWLGH